MSGVQVLLADDHAIVRSGIRKMVEEMDGLTVVEEVGNGTRVFEALEIVQVDLLIIDVTMPEFDPITAIRKIRGRYPALKILVVSAYDDDVYVQGLLGVGVNGYHLKDQPLNDLKLAIRRILDGERWISSPLIGKLVGEQQNQPILPDLTNRQRELLRFLQQGLDNQSIAHESGLSVKTVENHLTRLYRQLSVQSRLEAVNYIRLHPQILGTPGQEAAQDDPKAEIGVQPVVPILIVDDNNRYRKQLRRMIGRLCPRTTIYEAEDSTEALHLAERADFKLALIDVVLGDDDGIQCARRLKKIKPQCRVILISAYPDREFRRLGLRSGAVAFLDKKDLDLPTLRQMVEDVLS